MAQGKRYDDEVTEKAHALLLSGNTVSFVSSRLNLPYSTVRTWEKNYKKKGDDFTAIRTKKKEEFISSAWGLIDKSKELLERRLDRALEYEKDLDELVSEILKLDYKVLTDAQRKTMHVRLAAIKVDSAKEIAVILGTLYDKQALASKEATAIIDGNITVKKFEDFK